MTAHEPAAFRRQVADAILPASRQGEQVVQASMGIRRNSRAWLWLLPLLLLATAQALPQLDNDAFHHDEAYSMYAAGALRPGPNSLTAVWAATAQRSSEQALGWPMLLSVWGRLAGWSEYAARVLPLFAGVLTIALVYRTGDDLLSPPAGRIAALLLTGSAFFLTYFSIARAFSLVAFFATLCLRCYWRLALHPRPPGRLARTGLLAGSLGLLYAHYFGALILPVLGLFHLLFVHKNRRWWLPVALVGLALLVAALQLPVLLTGLQRTLGNEWLHQEALDAAAVLERLLRFLSNDLLGPAAPVGAVLTILVPLALMSATLWRLRTGVAAEATWLLSFASAGFLVLVLAANALLQVIHVSRMRYLIVLWPTGALLAAALLRSLATRFPRLLAACLALWLLLGMVVSLGTPFRYDVDYLRRSDFHRIYRLIRDNLPASDFLILDFEAEWQDPGRLYTRLLGLPYKIIYRHRDDPLESVGAAHLPYAYAWLLFRSQDAGAIAEQGVALGRVYCDRLADAWGYTLERHALSATYCPNSPARLQFDSGIQLAGPEVRLEDGLLRLFAGLRSEDDALLARYSLAVHLIDTATGRRVAQGDVGVGPGSLVPLLSEIDLSALPAGDYELGLALYDWQTGARLNARDLETGATGDMHTLYRFKIE